MNKIILTLISVATVSVLGCAQNGMHHKGEHKAKAHKMWQKMDANSDGSVTKDEFIKMHEEMFTKMDGNKDGKVTTEEMMAAHKDMKKKKGGCKDCK